MCGRFRDLKKKCLGFFMNLNTVWYWHPSLIFAYARKHSLFFFSIPVVSQSILSLAVHLKNSQINMLEYIDMQNSIQSVKLQFFSKFSNRNIFQLTKSSTYSLESANTHSYQNRPLMLLLPWLTQQHYCTIIDLFICT